MRFAPTQTIARAGGGLLLAGVFLSACSAGPDAGDTASEGGRLLIDGGTVVVMDDAGTVLEGGAVLVEGDRISAVLDGEAPRPAGVTVLDATGHLVIPGLVNTHGHAAMSLLRGLADDMPLMTWLNEHIFPAEAELVDPEFVYWGTLLSSIEMLKSGTTTFADMYYFRDDAARAVIDAGIRAVMGPHVIGFPAPDFASPAATLADAAEFMEAYRDHPTLVPGTAAHSLYTTSLDDVRAALRLAIDHGAPFQIHTAEDASEFATATERTGMGVVEALESIGALRPGTVLAHSIYLSDEDIERIAAGGGGGLAQPAEQPQARDPAGGAGREAARRRDPRGAGDRRPGEQQRPRPVRRDGRRRQAPQVHERRPHRAPRRDRLPHGHDGRRPRAQPPRPHRLAGARESAPTSCCSTRGAPGSRPSTTSIPTSCTRLGGATSPRSS